MSDSIRPKYMTIKQACQYSGLSRTRIYEFLWRLRPKKCGTRTLIHVWSLDELLASLPNAKVRSPPR